MAKGSNGKAGGFGGTSLSGSSLWNVANVQDFQHAIDQIPNSIRTLGDAFATMAAKANTAIGSVSQKLAALQSQATSAAGAVSGAVGSSGRGSGGSTWSDPYSSAFGATQDSTSALTDSMPVVNGGWGNGGNGGNASGYGQFSGKRLAAGAALMGTGAALNAFSGQVSQGITTSQLGMWLSGIRGGSTSSNATWALNNTLGWGNSSLSKTQQTQDLMNAMQIIGSAGYGPTSQRSMSGLATAGAFATIGQNVGQNTTLTQAAGLQSWYGTAAGQLAQQQAAVQRGSNTFSTIDQIIGKAQGASPNSPLTAKMISNLATPGTPLYNKLFAVMQGNTQQTQIAASYAEHVLQHGSAGFSAAKTLASGNLTAAEANKALGQLGFQGTTTTKLMQAGQNSTEATASSSLSAAGSYADIKSMTAATEKLLATTTGIKQMLEVGGSIGGALAALGGLKSLGSLLETFGPLVAERGKLPSILGGASSLISRLFGGGGSGGTGSGGAAAASAAEKAASTQETAATNLDRAAINLERAASALLGAASGGKLGGPHAPSHGSSAAPSHGSSAGAPSAPSSSRSVLSRLGNNVPDILSHGLIPSLSQSAKQDVSGVKNGISFASKLGAMFSWFGGASSPGASSAAGSASTTSGASGGSAGARIVSDAEKYLGVPYVWGGTNPKTGLDCSGLTQLVFKDMGINLPRVTQDQVKMGTGVPNLKSAQPGDLLFFGGGGYDGTPSAPGHVGIYMGGGKMIDAPYPGTNVRVETGFGKPVAIRRIIGGIGGAVASSSVTSSSAGASAGTSAWSPLVGLLGEGNAGQGENTFLTSALLTSFSGPAGASSPNVNGGRAGGLSGQGSGASTATASASSVTPAVGSHSQLITQSLRLAGIAPTAANISAVNTIVTHESSWNPTAINRTDSNALAGHPSQGLMQTIPSTFAAYAIPGHNTNIDDPLSNLIAGERYAESRYGSLSNVPGVAAVAAGRPYVGYEMGAQNIDRDQLAQLHRGEMVIRAPQAAMMRANQMQAGKAPLVNVEKGAINFTLGGTTTGASATTPSAPSQQNMQEAADQFWAHIERKAALSKLAAE